LDKLFSVKSRTERLPVIETLPVETILPVTPKEPVITKLSALRSVTSPTKFALPLTFSDPVKAWLSSDELPNLVEPLSKIIDAETNSV
jgi:hypothetical protein